MQEGDPERRIGEQSPEVGEHRLATLDGVANRVLHPRVGGQDEERGEDRPDADEPDGREMDGGGEAFPPEDPQADERRLEEEGQQALDGEGGTEDVAHEDREGRPVQAEFKLEHDPGDHSDGQADQEDPAEEAAQPVPRLVLADERQGLHDGHQESQSDGHGDEEEVEDGDDCELPAREIEGHSGPILPAAERRGQGRRSSLPRVGGTHSRLRVGYADGCPGVPGAAAWCLAPGLPGQPPSAWSSPGGAGAVPRRPGHAGPPPPGS